MSPTPSMISKTFIWNSNNGSPYLVTPEDLEELNNDKLIAADCESVSFRPRKIIKWCRLKLYQKT